MSTISELSLGNRHITTIEELLRAVFKAPGLYNKDPRPAEWNSVKCKYPLHTDSRLITADCDSDKRQTRPLVREGALQ
jgi:hypothetical protein